jgi:bacteriorhodopsin
MTGVAEAKKTGEPGWSWRKAAIFPNVAVSFWLIYLMISGPDTRVNETIAWGLIINIISSLFFYTGFATAQDIAAILATRSGLPYAQPPAVDQPGVQQ